MTVINITKRKEAEQERNKLLKALAESENKFFLRAMSAAVEFKMAKNNEVKGMDFTFNGKTTQASKMK